MSEFVNFFLCISDSLVVYFFCLFILKVKCNKSNYTKFLILSILAYLIYLFSYTNNLLEYSVILNFISVISIMTFLFKLQFLEIFYLALFYFGLGFITILLINLLNLLPFFHIKDYATDSTFRVYFALITRLLIIIILNSISKYMFIKLKATLSKKRNYTLLIIIVSNILIISAFFYISFLIHATSFSLIIIFCLILILINLSIILGIFLYIQKLEQEKNILEAKNELANLSRFQLKLIQETNTEIRETKHHLKHALASLDYLIQNNKIEDTKIFIKHTEEIFNKVDKLISSGNLVIDSVCNYYIKNNPEIDFEHHIMLGTLIEIDELDLSILFGNILSNAVEACFYVTQRKWISITIKTINNNFLIKISNTYNKSKSAINLKTTKHDRANHGYGIDGVKNIVSKYNGVFDIKFLDDVCELSILLKL